MKKVVSLLLTLCMLCSMISVSAAEATVSFVDVKSEDPAYDAIMYLATKGFVNGKGNSLFGPNDTVKREELAKIIANIYQLRETKDAPVFTDVAEDTWYKDFVSIIAGNKLMIGVSETEFGVGEDIIRQDLAVLIKRFAEKRSVLFDTKKTVLYADMDKVEDYAKDAVTTLCAAGIMEAKENNCFEPYAPATRVETAMAIYNVLMLRESQVEALGRYADHTQYQPPFDLPDDRLQQAMPEMFDISKIDGTVIHYEDYEDEDFGEFTYKYGSDAAKIVPGAGIDGSSAFVIEGDETGIYFPQLCKVYDPGEVRAGDYYIMTVMVKAEGIEGPGHFRGILTINNDEGKWLTESNVPSGKASVPQWTKYEYVVMVPFGAANTYETPDFYEITLGMYKNKLKGKVYFDNMTLKKARFDPMNTVLMTPNYKGLITEENGVGDITLRAYVDHLNVWDLGTFDFTAQVTDEDHNVLMKSENKNVTSVMDVYFSSKDLEVDKNYYLESILTDKETGEVIQKQEWPLYKKAPDFVPAIGYDEYGRVTKNGEPFFPRSVYNWQTPEYSNMLWEAGSLNVVQQGDFGSTVSFGTSKLAQENDAAYGEHGMLWNLQARAFAQRNESSSWTYAYVPSWEDERGALGRMARNFTDAPNIFGYYLWDEQNPIQFGKQLEWTRKIIEKYDSNHPTLCAIDFTHDHRKGIYAKTSDFLGYDPYPVTGKHTSLSRVYDYIITAKKVNPNRPVYAILQNFWFKSRGDTRGPVKEEFRNMAFQAIIAGACMLDCFDFSSLIETPSLPDKTTEECLAVMTDIYQEIADLEPVILSAAPAPYYEVNAGKWFKSMTKRHDGKSYLFAVNTEIEKGTARVKLDGVKQITSIYTSKTYTADRNGWFTINMSGFGTDVFEYEQEDYKSSHAELKRFGLAGITMMNSESEVPCFVVPNGTTEVEYSVAISDFAKFYINGVEMEKKGTINLSGLDKLEIKVVSEDERFTTEKTYEITWVNK